MGRRRRFSIGGNGGDVDNESKLSSSRARAAVNLLPSYLVDARAIVQYSPSTPDGALQLSVAENQLAELPVEGLRGIREPTMAGGIATVGKKDMRLSDVLSMLASSNVARPTDEGARAMSAFERDMIYYQPTHGVTSVREAMADFLHDLLVKPTHPHLKSRKFDPDNVVLGAGCNAVLENLCMCLADPGDAILVPTPYYAAFEFDLVSRAGCKIVSVNTFDHHEGEEAPSSSSHAPIAPHFYYPNESSLDAAYDRAVLETGRAPRVLLLSHPNNPLGICYPPQVMEECIAWCRERRVHLVSDEIYAGSVYREERSSSSAGEPTFVSAMALGANCEDDNDADDDNNANVSSPGLGLGPYVHLVYALSKDFALSGLRVGAAYTENPEIKLPFQKLNDLCQISSQTQLLLERMLRADAVVATADDDDGKQSEEDASQEKFVDVYLKANRANVRARCDRLQSHLDELRIPHLRADSGLFVWMDLREFLPPLIVPSDDDDVTTTEEEATESIESKERRERRLYLSLMKDYGLLFTPGMSMRNERAGFFRFVFTAAGGEEFELGLARLTEFVKAMRG